MYHVWEIGNDKLSKILVLVPIVIGHFWQNVRKINELPPHDLMGSLGAGLMLVWKKVVTPCMKLVYNILKCCALGYEYTFCLMYKCRVNKYDGLWKIKLAYHVTQVSFMSKPSHR